MDRGRVITIFLVAFSCAAIAMIAGNCIGRSASDEEQMNYLHSTFYDFEHASEENLQARRYECVDIDYKAARYLRAGARAADIKKLDNYCSALR